MASNGTLESGFPSLELGYERVKDVLRDQATIVSNYINRAITLFAVATAMIGIGLPLLSTKPIYQQELVIRLPAVILVVIPIALYALVFIYFWRVMQPEFIRSVPSPKTLLDEGHLELDKSEFYSEVLQDIAEAFSENECVIKKKGKSLVKLTKCITWMAAVIVIIVLLFSSLGIM